MSRIGKKPVKIPSGVKVEVKDQLIKISSSSATLELEVHPDIKIEYDTAAAEISVHRPSDARQYRALHGTMRALIANMVEGVTKGFSKKMEIYGAGYGVKMQGKELVLNVGFAAPVHLPILDGIKVDIATPNARGNDTPAVFSISGPDKITVGQFSADVRRARPAEP